MTSWRTRALWIAIAVALPAAIIFWGNAVFIWNHFLEGPFLQDAGWYSAIIHKRGFFPSNPPAADSRPEYFSIHVSLAVSLTSLLSYAFPGDRIDWYCIFQGAIYAPLGALGALLVGRDPPRTDLRDAAMVGAAALVFGLNGQAIACMEYPHYEILVSVGVCILLLGLVRGSMKLALVGLAVAAGAREDGGLHAFSFLLAVLACDLSRRAFPIPRRRVLAMAAAALALSVVAIVVQRVVFHSAGLFKHEYLGEPPFAHLTSAELARRTGVFFRRAEFVALPLLATVAIAVATRDARYLLGWAVEVPWLVLNFLAAQDLKATFAIYTGFPFVVSIFWVGVYAHLRGDGRRRTLALLAAVSASSTVGLVFAWPHIFVDDFRRAAWPKPIPRSTLLSFSRVLREDPRAYGNIYVDPGIASWALERLPEDARLWHDGRRRADDDPYSPAYFEGIDGFAFYRRGLMEPIIAGFLAGSPLRHCGNIPGTEVFFCTREGHPLPPGFEPRSPLLDSLVALLDRTPRTRAGFEIAASPARELRVWGPFARLSPGRYEATWDVEWRTCAPGDGPMLEMDVFVPFHEIAHLNVLHTEAPIRIVFELAGPSATERVELRTSSGRCSALLRDVRLVRL